MDMRCFSFNWAHCRLMLFLRDCFRRLLNRSNKLSAQRLFFPHSLYSADYRFGLWVGTSFPSHVRIIACSSEYFHSLFFSLVLCLYRDNCLFWVFATRNCRAIIWYSACVCVLIFPVWRWLILRPRRSASFSFPAIIILSCYVCHASASFSCKNFGMHAACRLSENRFDRPKGMRARLFCRFLLSLLCFATVFTALILVSGIFCVP